ncbi:MAG: hypothetical protein QXP45_02120 [Thermoproteota archaeon]
MNGLLIGGGLGSKTGSFVFFDDVQIQVVFGRSSVITISFDSARFKANNTATIYQEDPITISGYVFPSQTSSVKLEYMRPNGSIVERQVASDPSGKYIDIYIPDSIGIWSVTASWIGSKEFDGSTSPPIYFSVTSGKTLFS